MMKHSGKICIVDKVVIAMMFATAVGMILLSWYHAEMDRAELCRNSQILIEISKDIADTIPLHKEHEGLHHIHLDDGSIERVQ